MAGSSKGCIHIELFYDHLGRVFSDLIASKDQYEISTFKPNRDFGTELAWPAKFSVSLRSHR